MAREILAELRSHFSDKMFRTIVNFNTKIKEASSFGQPINEYDSASKGQKDFQALAEEVIGSEAKQKRHQMVNSLADQLESISITADELVKTAKPQIRAVQAPKTRKPPIPEVQIVQSQAAKTAQARELSHEPRAASNEQPADTSAKLSDYYGVNQIDDAIVFVTLYPRASSVQIAGDFNNWQPVKTPLQKVGDSGVWQTKVKLHQGKYRYRLVVDGQWQQDPYNELTELNPFGDFNSVLEVK